MPKLATASKAVAPKAERTWDNARSLEELIIGLDGVDSIEPDEEKQAHILTLFKLCCAQANEQAVLCHCYGPSMARNRRRRLAKRNDRRASARQHRLEFPRRGHRCNQEAFR